MAIQNVEHDNYDRQLCTLNITFYNSINGKVNRSILSLNWVLKGKQQGQIIHRDT